MLGAGGSLLIPWVPLFRFKEGVSQQMAMGRFSGPTKQAMVQGRAPAPSGNWRANEDQKKLPLSETGHMTAVRANVQPISTNVTSSHPEPLGQVKYNRDSSLHCY